MSATVTEGRKKETKKATTTSHSQWKFNCKPLQTYNQSSGMKKLMSDGISDHLS